MTKEQLVKENQDVYEEIKKDGMNGERARIRAIMKRLDEYQNIPEICAALDKAIADGTELEKIASLISTTILEMRKNGNDI